VELLDHVGGDEFAYCLLSPLETLANVEEFSIRAKMVESSRDVINRLSQDHITTYFLPMVHTLSTKEWFTSRMSASFLIPVGLSRASSPQDIELLLSWFSELGKDETPMVRRTVLMNLWRAAEFVEEGSEGMEGLLSMFSDLISDPQDSVRIQTVDNVVHLSPILSKTSEEKKENEEEKKMNEGDPTAIDQLIDIATAIASDKAWRVRWTMASKFSPLCQALSLFPTSSLPLAIAFKLLLEVKKYLLISFFIECWVRMMKLR